jgi:hypothetical protein
VFKYLALILFTLSAHAEWIHEPVTSQYLDLNPLRFTNRAECALDSKKPTKSFFIMADSLNVGKALYRVAQSLKQPDSFSVEGVRRYRYTVFSLAKIISDKLLKGELPLLKAGNEEYDEAISHCDSEGNCLEIEALIQKYWQKTFQDPTVSKMVGQQGAHASCYALKSFSPLEAHLYGVKPDVEALNKVAVAVHKHPEYIQTCSDSLQEEDLKVGVYQIDLRNISDEEWDEKGFYFWNSFKLYFSWAFRFSPESKQLSGRYQNFLQKIDLEESVLFFANGCRTMMAPECGKDYLNLSSLRSLAMSQGNVELSKLDYFELNPAGSSNQVMDPAQPAVNRDILGLTHYSKSSEWANNFRENMAKTRGYYKLKLAKSVSLINLIKKNIGTELLDLLKNHTEKSLASENKSQYLKELYLTCSEFRIALDSSTSFLRKDLLKIKREPRLQGIADLISEDTMSDLNWLLDDFSPKVITFCDGLEKNKVWEKTDRPRNADFSNWYQDYVFNVKSASTNLKFVDNVTGKPLLKIVNPRKINDDENIICSTPAHCGRLLLSSLVDLKAFGAYASGFLSFDESIKSPDLFNPMSERVACRSYDPWFKTKKTVSDLLQDMFMGVVWGQVPSPIYVDISLKPKEITSFNEMVKDGKVFYDPKFDRKRTEMTLVSDFGPLLGTPCAVAVSNATQPRPPQYLALEGITFQACKGGEKNTMNVYGPDEIEKNKANGTGCFSCTISLTSIASSAGKFTPGIRPFVFLVRGVVRLFQNLRDPNDIPHSWEANPNSVYRSWRRNGSVFTSCKRKLLDGEECLATACEAKLTKSFEELHQKYISSIVIYPGEQAEIKVNGDSQVYGVSIPRFSCGVKEYRREDFFALRKEE